MKPDERNILDEPYPLDSSDVMFIVICAGFILGGLVSIGLFLLY